MKFFEVHYSDPSYRRKDLGYLAYREEWENNPRTCTIRDWPIHLDIEASSWCNVKCKVCDRQPLEDTGDMPLDRFRRIITEIKNHVPSIKLSVRGEPLMNDDLERMVLVASSAGIIDIGLSTNGLLINKNMVYWLIDFGLNRITFSMDGYDPATYGVNRRHKDFWPIYYNITTLREMRELLKAKKPIIRVQTIRQPHIDMAKYVNFWKYIADEITSTGIKRNGSARPETHDWHCTQPWQRLTVLYDGTILACNEDKDKMMRLGNVDEISICDAWHSPRMDILRLNHAGNRPCHILTCLHCSLRAAELEARGGIK